jgi:hypothetical protein
MLTDFSWTSDWRPPLRWRGSGSIIPRSLSTNAGGLPGSLERLHRSSAVEDADYAPWLCCAATSNRLPPPPRQRAFCPTAICRPGPRHDRYGSQLLGHGSTGCLVRRAVMSIDREQPSTTSEPWGASYPIRSGRRESQPFCWRFSLCLLPLARPLSRLMASEPTGISSAGLLYKVDTVNPPRCGAISLPIASVPLAARFVPARRALHLQCALSGTSNSAR